MKEKIYVAGHRGMVGQSILRQLISQGVKRSDIVVRSRNELNLTNQAAVEAFFESERPSQVYLAAAKVGGIQANNVFPAESIYENLMVQANVIHEAQRHGVNRLLFLGSSCIYPKLAPQPMPESALLTGPLEPTNEPYAIAKIAGIKLCESYNRQYGCDFRSIMPSNLYGPGDNYHQENSHVVAALIRRFHEAKLTRAPHITVWGSGTPRREFLYVDDMARASVLIMNLDPADYQKCVQPQMSFINVGSGSDITIAELAQAVSKVIGYEGKIKFDTNKPDGTPRKLMDSSRLLGLGWRPSIKLSEGLRMAYRDFLSSEGGD